MATLKGGKRLEKWLIEMAEKVKNPATLRVGFLEKAKYPDGTPVAMIAAIQDGGAPRAGIPPRPFFRNMIAAKKGEWPKAIGGLLQRSDYDAVKALEIAGAAIAGQLRESIINTNEPPLKPATILRKGGTRGMKYDPGNRSTYPAKPLVDKGIMLNSADYEVKRTK